MEFDFKKEVESWSWFKRNRVRIRVFIKYKIPVRIGEKYREIKRRLNDHRK